MFLIFVQLELVGHNLSIFHEQKINQEFRDKISFSKQNHV